MDSINENLYKIVIDYAKFCKPGTDMLIKSEAMLALFSYKSIVMDKAFDNDAKIQKIKDIYSKYDLDFDSFEY